MISEFKTWSKYTEWLTSCANPYAEEIEKFDEHSDYYCVDIKMVMLKKWISIIT